MILKVVSTGFLAKRFSRLRSIQFSPEDELKSDFANDEIIKLAEKEIELSEGLFHNGKDPVICFVGRKK